MDEIVVALADQHAELAVLVTDLDEAGWRRPSRCEGWTVADVVLHLSQSDEMALGSLEGRFVETLEEMSRGLEATGSVDVAAERMVARDRSLPGAEIGERWRSGAEALRKALDAFDPHQRVAWVAGQLSVQTLATTRLAETWIHTGDVGAAFGAQPSCTDRLRPIARLAWRTLPYAFAQAGRELSGPVAFSLTGPRGEQWDYMPDAEPVTTIHGDAFELCLVAARRAAPADTGLKGEGPDAAAVLELVRTYA